MASKTGAKRLRHCSVSSRRPARDIAARNGNKNAETLRFGLAPNRATLQTIIVNAFEQKLLPRKFTVVELFDDTTRSLS